MTHDYMHALVVSHDYLPALVVSHDYLHALWRVMTSCMPCD